MAGPVIEKRITLNAPVSRVWRALTDSREFGEWFKVKFTERSSSAARRVGRSRIPASST